MLSATQVTAEGTPGMQNQAPLPGAPQGTPLLAWGKPLAMALSAISVTATTPSPSLAAMRLIAERSSVTRSVAAHEEYWLLLGRHGLPAMVHGLVPHAPSETSPQQETAQRAVKAVERLSSLLGISEEAVADLAGFSRRSTSNWRRGQGVYPKTVRALFESAALVESLSERLGKPGLLAWLSGGSPDDVPRRDLLASSEGRGRLLSEAHRLLFESVPTDPAVDISDWSESELAAASQTPKPGFTDARANRRTVD